MDFLKSNIRIVQMSQTRSGSTLLSNILYGLFQPDEPICFCSMDTHQILSPFIHDHFILKTHSEQPSEINSNFPQYTIYYVASVRPSRGKINHKKYVKTVPRFIAIDYDLISGDVEESVDNVVRTLQQLLPTELMAVANKETAVGRIKAMNDRYDQIKDLPFVEYDPFFKIHGHHRNRDHELGRPDK